MTKILLRPLLLFLLLFPVSVSTAFAVLEYGETAPDFTLADFSGHTVHLSDFKGKIVVLKLATTWCPTCKQQMQEIGDVIGFLDENNVTVLDVFLQDTREMVDEYLTGHAKPKSYIPLMDDGQVRKDYNVYLIPRLLIIDPAGKVRRDGSLIASSDLKQLIKAITKAP
jgi:thiol-disulfide isomerase/thioredoxin